MAQPVWVLSVDLQTKTATFTSGLGDAARAARGTFGEIGDGANRMGKGVGYSMSEARHSVMLLGEEFGVHLPRALTSFIASLGPIGGALEAAFPFLAIVVGATLLLEHLAKVREEGEKLTESQIRFGTTVSNVLNGLNDKLLEAGIKTDELNGDHLAALNKQLELIDHQSMSELVHAFDTIAKSADATFAQLKSSWYQFGTGATGAKHALEDFKAHYDALMAEHKDKEADDLLAGTLKSAEAVLAAQKQARDNESTTGLGGAYQKGDYQKFLEAVPTLKKASVGYTEKEITAQETLVDALRAQVEVAEKNAALKKAQQSNVVHQEANRENADAERALQQQAANERKIQEDEDREREQARAKAIADLNEQEKLQIDATERGSQERLAAIDHAIKEEQAKGLQETSFFRQLLIERVNTEREIEEKAEREKEQRRRAAWERQWEFLEARGRVIEQQNRRIAESEGRMDAEIARGLTSVIMRHQSFGQMMASIGDQLVSGMIENSLKMIMANDMTKLSDAKFAARQGWKAGSRFPFPVDLVMEPVLAAAAFASVMAYEGGGIVPGAGKGDVVPAMLTPGESVIPKGMTERLNRAADDGGTQRGDVHLHFRPTYHVNAIDGASVRGMLREHNQEFSQHFQSELRKLNQ